MLYLIVAIVSIGLLSFLIIGWRCNGIYHHTHKITKKFDALYAEYFSTDNILGLILWFVAWLNIIIFIVMSVITLCSITCKEATYARLETERECLVYELENNLYNDNGDDVVGKKELYSQIRKFNTEVAYNKTMNDNLWVGIFYSDAYESIEPILLK
jgi:hypothetical protein